VRAGDDRGIPHRGDPAAVWQINGAGLYLVSVLILVGYHVPHNDQLIKVDPNAAGQVPPAHTPARHGWTETTPRNDPGRPQDWTKAYSTAQVHLPAVSRSPATSRTWSSCNLA
jgi:hypothetical protein